MSIARLSISFYLLAWLAFNSSAAEKANPPALVNWSGPINVYTRGVYLRNGNAILNYRHEAQSQLIIAVKYSTWKEIILPNNAVGYFAFLAAIEDDTWLATQGSDAWVSQDTGRSWIRATSIPPLASKSDRDALSQLGHIGILKWDARSQSVVWKGPKVLSHIVFKSVCPISSNVAVAAVSFNGRFGAETFGLLGTADAGYHWKWLVKEGGYSFDPSGNYLAHHVFFLTLQSGWISSDYMDNIFHTADGGTTWSHLKTPDRVVSAMYFKNEHDGRVIGSSTARIFETKNGGTSWREMSDEEVLAPSFVEYFAGCPGFRWNDFAVYRLLLTNR